MHTVCCPVRLTLLIEEIPNLVPGTIVAETAPKDYHPAKLLAVRGKYTRLSTSTDDQYTAYTG